MKWTLGRLPASLAANMMTTRKIMTANHLINSKYNNITSAISNIVFLVCIAVGSIRDWVTDDVDFRHVALEAQDSKCSSKKKDFEAQQTLTTPPMVSTIHKCNSDSHYSNNSRMN